MKTNREEIEKKVSEIIVDKLGVVDSEVNADSHFYEDLGGDSLDAIEVIMEFEKEFNITIPDDQADRCKTVKDMCDVIEKLS